MYYSLPKFLGKSAASCEELGWRGGSLYQLVIYLCPGDYHRFHSPAVWQVTSVTHIWGELLSVAPPILRRVQVRVGLGINFELKTLISKKFEWSDFERHFTAGPSGTSRLRVSRPLSNLLPQQNYSQMLAKNSQTSYCGSEF